jgi:hypothetical protein
MSWAAIAGDTSTDGIRTRGSTVAERQWHPKITTPMKRQITLRDLFSLMLVVAFFGTAFYYLPLWGTLELLVLFVLALPVLFYPQPSLVAIFWSLSGAVFGYHLGFVLGMVAGDGHVLAGSLGWLLAMAYGLRKFKAWSVLLAMVVVAALVVGVLSPGRAQTGARRVEDYARELIMPMILLAIAGILITSDGYPPQKSRHET